ncbi:UNVERIFIED_CONTAM: hypothetical protein FKN15_013233 [Acipenser sinensis]
MGWDLYTQGSDLERGWKNRDVLIVSAWRCALSCSAVCGRAGRWLCRCAGAAVLCRDLGSSTALTGARHQTDACQHLGASERGERVNRAGRWLCRCAGAAVLCRDLGSSTALTGARHQTDACQHLGASEREKLPWLKVDPWATVPFLNVITLGQLIRSPACRMGLSDSLLFD